MNNLSTTQILSGNLTDAQNTISQALSLNTNKYIDFRLKNNLAITHLHLGNYKNAFDIIQENNPFELESVFPDKQDLEISAIRQAKILQKILSQNNANNKSLILYSFNLLNQILSTSSTKENRASAYLLQSILYSLTGQTKHAIDQALKTHHLAQQIQNPELIFKSNWQLARYYKQATDINAAIDYYQNSINNIEKHNISLSDVFDKLSLRSSNTAEVYIEYADALLNRTSSLTHEEKQVTLQTARKVIEKSKAVDLQNYFKDQCVTETQQRIRTLESIIDNNTAVLYPIAFNDRLELLLSLENEIKQFTLPLNKLVLLEDIKEFRQHLEKRRSRSYLDLAQHLYDTIVRPIENELKAAQVSTLIAIPGYGLNGLPLAALHDGNQFLIEKYALATSPGLNLTDTGRPDSAKTILLTGLSESVSGYAPLNHVQKELNDINQHFQSEIMLDEQFNSQSLSTAFTNETYSIAHIATHGEFNDDIQKSFVLAYDKKINVGQLADYIGFNRFRDTPLDLLTLSACHTAAGNEKAALGLAGITVKAGSRSALATLWQVNDEATSLLMNEFYKNLKQNNLGKARSLQLAQRNMIGNIRYRHPGYWAPFLLIGNWL
ncbi:MAG: CHAT domain-containing protein [Gammaproteobacteria bacterium]|nr:CHAT domain-containing protein [Gammaproteobacteria bacterium]